MTKRLPCVKAIAYIRASTGGDRQETTPKDQQEKIEAYCKMAGLDLVDVITERGVSGKVKLSKRPEGAKVLALLESGVCHIVALKLDRLFRNASDALSCVEEWEAAGIHLHLIDMGGQSVNTASSIGKMLLTMLAGFAEFERNLIAERTTSALSYKKAHGQVYTRAVFGFDKAAGMMVPNPGEQRIIARMWALRAEGVSYSGIANELNEDGVVAKAGGQWHPFAVQKILVRER